MCVGLTLFCMVATIILVTISYIEIHPPDLIKIGLVVVALQILNIRYRRQQEAPLIAVINGACLLITFAGFYAVATYMVPEHASRLWDQTFVMWDAALGLSADTIVRAVRSIEWLDTTFAIIYFCYFLQLGLVVPYTAGVRRSPERMYSALAQIFICAIFALIIFAFMPALNAMDYFKYEDIYQTQPIIDHIKSIRAGTFTKLKFEENIQGLIQFPSMHAGLAVVFAWEFRHDHKIVFGALVLWNILVIFSAITTGAHYVVDIFGGVFIAILSIFIVHWITREPLRPNQ